MEKVRFVPSDHPDPWPPPADWPWAPLWPCAGHPEATERALLLALLRAALQRTESDAAERAGEGWSHGVQV